jgi:hypothetical protein
MGHDDLHRGIALHDREADQVEATNMWLSSQ